MAKERTVVQGIVLRGVDTKESDRILTVLTPQLGKVAVVAKGARSRRSRIAAGAQLLVYSDMVLTESHGWQILSEANTISLFDGVRQDVVLLSLGSYFADLTESVTLEGTESGEILRLLLNALYALGTLQKPPELVRAAFELRLMALVGFAPLLDGCAVCGETEPAQPVLDIRGGILRCRCCGGEGGLSLTPGALAAMRHVVYGDAKRLYSFTLAGEDQRCLSLAAESYVRAMLERDFRTLDFYKSLRGTIPAAEPVKNVNDK